MNREQDRAIAGSRTRIMVISCDVIYADLIHELLDDEGYDLIMCNGSQHAYERICYEQPALVLLDRWLEHPHAGEMILGLMHVNPAICTIPVVVCTTDPAFVRDQSAALRARRCDVLLKPFDLRELLTAINRLTCRPSARLMDDAEPHDKQGEFNDS